MPLKTTVFYSVSFICTFNNNNNNNKQPHLNNSRMFVDCVDFDLLLDVVSCNAVVDLSNSCKTNCNSSSCKAATTDTFPDQEVVSVLTNILLGSSHTPCQTRAVSSATEDEEAALEEKNRVPKTTRFQQQQTTTRRQQQ